jgi:GST-like protein
VIVDTATEQTITESGAILIHLAEKVGALLPADPAARMVVLQWLLFQVGSIGPMAGQYNHFRRHEPRDNYALERYRDEIRRLLGVMKDAMKDWSFMAGDYSIADVALVQWLRVLQRWDLSLTEYLNFSAWYQRLMARPAVSRGFAILDTSVRSKNASAEPDTDEGIRVARNGSTASSV